MIVDRYGAVINTINTIIARSSGHFYTSRRAEGDNAVQNLGYTEEGSPGYIYPQQNPGTIPLYRFLSTRTGHHFYTTSRAEGDNAVQNLGHTEESSPGFVFGQAYVCQPSQQIVLPLHRYYNSGSDDHFYTTGFGELGGGI